VVIALFALGILAAPAAAADGTVTGTVTVNGVLASSGIGVGACPVGEQGPFCPSLNTTFTEIDGTYDLVLPEGQWNVGTFNPDPFFLGSGQTVDVPGGGSVIVNLVLDYGTVAGSVGERRAAPGGDRRGRVSGGGSAGSLLSVVAVGLGGAGWDLFARVAGRQLEGRCARAAARVVDRAG
jgi:hypothetical protein